MSQKLNCLSRSAALARMNDYGRNGRPFFFLIDFDESKCIVEEPSNLSSDDILYSFPNAASDGLEAMAAEYSVRDFYWRTSPQSFDEYSRSFDVVRRNIYGGNSFLTNLTCETPVTTNMSLKDIFFGSKAMYRLWMRDKFVMFSPEIFVRISDGMIYSHPMKGTIDADIPDAESKILNDVKESAEHATITDLIRNDLSRVATEVCVARYRYIDRIETHKGRLLQVSSEIKGRLPEDYCNNIGDIIFQLLPAGSVTGAPKKKTVEIIREAETYSRGYYTGVTGFFDGRNLDSAVVIRYVEQKADGSMVFKSGGGITFMSDAESEYQEMIMKAYVPLQQSRRLEFVETVCIIDGVVQNISAHNRRMNETRRYFWGNVPDLHLEDYIVPSSETSSGSGRIRCRVVYSDVVEKVEYFEYKIRPVKKLKLVVDDTADYSFKSVDRIVIDRNFSCRGEADDVLIVRNGLITDTSIANVALLKDGEWYTPRTPLLHGTKRSVLIQNGTLKEMNIKVDELYKFEKIRLFNAMIDFGEIELELAHVFALSRG